jgi:hypothetical protein
MRRTGHIRERSPAAARSSSGRCAGCSVLLRPIARVPAEASSDSLAEMLDGPNASVEAVARDVETAALVSVDKNWLRTVSVRKEP